MDGLQNQSDYNVTLDPCNEEQDDGDFNIPLHIVSLFTMMLFSVLGVFIPIVARRCCHTTVSFDNPVLIFGKFFGGGVMVATGFIHILPAAVDTLTNACLPEFFTDRYPALPYVLVMLSALSLHIFEWITVRKQLTKIEQDKKKKKAAEMVELEAAVSRDDKSDKSDDNNRVISVSVSTTSSNGQDQETHNHGHVGHAHAHRDQHDVDIQMEMKSSVSTITLEVAVAIHSVIIGLALGVATTGFVSLWVALTFHQFFEGIGVGFKVADTKLYSTLAVVLTGIVFSFTTPVGIAIGIGITVAASKAPATNTLIAEGIFESISAGLLLYTALVSLTVDEFGSSIFHKLALRHRIIGFVAFYLGAVTMAFIGGWA